MNAIRKISGLLFKTLYLPPQVELPSTPRISLCTACMGRLHHLEKTFFKNLEDNVDYPNLEFVILNYSSPDKTEDWARQNLGPFIVSGKVQYYKTEEPKYFNNSHAKNISHRLASGDIVCNVDADNFTGKGFASYLANIFRQNYRTVVRGDSKVSRGTSGRIALLKEYFMLVSGYPESFQGWGHEDIDLINRLTAVGLDAYMIRDDSFLQTIPHRREESVRFYAEEFQHSKSTREKNRRQSLALAWMGKIRANQGRPWGTSRVFKNFSSEIITA